jgi:hypothetical protein
MPRQRKRQLIFRYTGAVVPDADQFLTAGVDINGYRSRARVQAVLDQFLYDGCRPLDNFAGGDLIDEVFG